jgi:hypothetical protein
MMMVAELAKWMAKRMVVELVKRMVEACETWAA